MQKFKLKWFVISTIFIAGILTVTFGIVKPQMHKPFQLNIIEYLLKINTDGSVTTTKTITTDGVKEK